jgi:hypothetical protein
LSEQEIEDLLTRADAYVAKGRNEGGRHMTFPEDDSALTLYRQVLDSDPGNERAKAGIKAITDYFKLNIYKLCENGNYVGCGSLARTALQTIDPADETLLQLAAAADQGERGESPQLPPRPR